MCIRDRAYDASDYAPRVVAKGRGLIAEQIIAKAKENGVFVHESKDLVALLMPVSYTHLDVYKRQGESQQYHY